MNDASKDSPSAEDKSPARKAAEAAAAHEHWRRAGLVLAETALERAEELAGRGEEKKEDKTVRQFGALVLSALRAMEMEHHYEQKVQPRDEGENAGDLERRRREQLERAREEARRILAEERAAGAGAMDPQS